MDILSAVRHSGPHILMVLPAGVAAFALSAIAVFRKDTSLVVAACWSSAGVAGAGAFIVWRLRPAFDSIVSWPLSGSETQQLMMARYGDLFALGVLTVMASGPALLTSVVALVRAERRRVEAMAGLVVAGVLIGFLLLTNGPEKGRARANELLAGRASSALARTDCDPCDDLATAIEVLGIDAVEDAAPGTGLRAKRCITDRLDVIGTGKAPSSLLPCTPSTFIDDSKGVSKDTRDELEALKESPLLFDPDQRKEVEARLAAAAPHAAPAPSSAETVEAPTQSSTASSGAESAAPRDASAVVASLMSRFRDCYQTGLKTDPDLAGSVRLTVHIGTKGEVVSVASAPKDRLAPILPCLETVASSAAFAPPKEGGPATMIIPLSFVPKK